MCLRAFPASIALLSLVLSLSRADDGQRPQLLLPTTGPIVALTPATRPTTQQAKVSPEAAPLLKEMCSAYARVKSLQASGKLSMAVKIAGKTEDHQSKFTSIFQSPNKFRQDADGQPELGCTGATLYAQSARSNVYMRADVAEGKPLLSQLPKDMQQTLPMANLSLVLAVSRDPEAHLRQIASEIARLPDEKVGGDNCGVLAITLAQDKQTLKVYVDPRTHLVRRVAVDFKPVMVKEGLSDVESALYAIDYDAVQPDAALPATAFDWSPLAGRGRSR